MVVDSLNCEAFPAACPESCGITQDTLMLVASVTLQLLIVQYQTAVLIHTADHKSKLCFKELVCQLQPLTVEDEVNFNNNLFKEILPHC